jgi:hypothetical protein
LAVQYQTLSVDLTVKPSPDEDLAAMAAEGWSVHTVLASDDTVFTALMEQSEPVLTSSQGRYQAPRQAVGPRAR